MNLKTSLLAGIILLTLIVVSLMYYFSKEKAIHIAFVTGVPENSQSIVQAAQLYVDSVNKQGGINGQQIVLDVFYDQDESDIAQEKALEIAEQNEAIAVIGHNFSASSLKAGEIYKKHQIPAITPFATNVKVTQDNDWYFRTIFNDQLQGRFLAHYVKTVFGQNRVSIIYDNDVYGRYLTQVFSETARSLDMSIKHQWAFSQNDAALDQTLNKIALELKAQSADSGPIFLAMHEADGVKVIKLIKDLGIKNSLIAADSMASPSLVENFKQYPKEQKTPGYYTDGLYVATPLIFDSANEQALQFKQAYQTQYPGEHPDWEMAFAYDALMMLIDAMQHANISATQKSLQADRQKLRDYLANLTDINKAVKGVAGFNYFDEQGNAQKPIYVGVYKHNTMVSALTQFQDVPNFNEITNLDSSEAESHILQMGDKYMYKTNVVYTGIKINEISEIDLTSLNYTLDFYLWFRMRGDIDPENLDFLNAVKPIKLGEPIEEAIDGDVKYRLYHVKGRFKADFLPQYRAFEQHVFGVSFRHRKLARHNLIYVMDALGMGLFKQESLAEKLEREQVLTSKYSGTITQVWLFQDMLTKESMGHPKHLKVDNSNIEYSRVNMGIVIKKDELSLLSLFPQRSAELVWFFTIFLVVLLLIVAQYNRFQHFYYWIYVLQLICVPFLLLSSEIILVNWVISHHIPSAYIEATIMAFDILWWIIGAIFIHLATDHFLWQPLEKKTGRAIPKIVHRLWIFTIYTLASLGIIAFVFEQTITSLLATSGVLAMIIGLAVQMNLSNIFSGLAINMERPFRVGDRVKIGSYDEGTVIDMNWRATRIQTLAGFDLTLQNSTVAESEICNFTSPDNFWLWPTVYVDARHPPKEVRMIMDEALLSVEGILTDPAPYTIYGGVNEWAAYYWPCVCRKEYDADRWTVLQSMWENILAAFDKAGIEIAVRRYEIQTYEGQNDRQWEPIMLPHSSQASTTNTVHKNQVEPHFAPPGPPMGMGGPSGGGPGGGPAGGPGGGPAGGPGPGG
jgi:potassium-dependent mechanosensitive channel